jgi:hypothetical protein
MIAPTGKGKAALLHAPISKLGLAEVTSVTATAPGQSCLVETPLAKWWHRRRNELRRCVVCGIAVKNENLAGYSGRSVLNGRVYCPDCEDVGGCL